MLNPISQKLKPIAAGAIFSSIFIVPLPTQANTVQYGFTTNLVESIFIEGAPEIGLEANPDFYKGTFTFDESLLTGIGLETIPALSVALEEDPRVNQDLDPRFPDFPTVSFQDGELLGLDWLAIYHPFSAVPELDYPGDFLRISGTELTDGFDPTFYTPEDDPRTPILGLGTVEYSSIPEPTLILHWG